MFNLLLALVGTAIFLLLGEILWRKRILKGEFARKFVHITCASYVAFWPLFLSHYTIAVISLIFVLVLIIVKKLKLFKSLRSVQRATYGEIWYALGIGVSALIFKENAVFAVAVLTMALADGFAAVVGVGLKKKAKTFKVRGVKKSVAGTATFILISFLINYIYWLFFSSEPLEVSAIAISLMAAIILGFIELVSPKGSDNVIVPVMAGLLVILPVAFS